MSSPGGSTSRRAELESAGAAIRASEIAGGGDDQLQRWVDQLHAESGGAVLDSTGERVPRSQRWVPASARNSWCRRGWG